MSDEHVGQRTRGGFRVPYAVGPDSKLVSAEDAQRGATYSCPSCYARVGLRAGELRRRHFAHQPDNESCSAESVKHMLAKMLVREVVTDWLVGAGPRPSFLRQCAGLRTTHGCSNIAEHRMPRVDSVEIEMTCDGLRPDVLFMLSGEPVAAVEIFATHRVAEPKRERTRLPWVELRADDVLALRDRWLPVQDFFRALHCAECLEKARDYRGRYAGCYLSGHTECHRCRRKIIVYSWDGAQWSNSAPPTPRPPTVKYAYSETLESRYWANTCQHCGALQGDFFLYSWPDGPFGGLDSVVPPDRLFEDRCPGWAPSAIEQFIAERSSEPSKLDLTVRESSVQ